LAPAARAPRFNAILAYRLVGLEELEREAWTAFQHFEKNVRWVRELTPRTPPTESELIGELRLALEHHDRLPAQELFRKKTDTYRYAATDYALNPANPDNTDSVVRFIVDEFRNGYHDETIPAILEPLSTKYRDRIIETRKLVHAGAE